MNIKKITVLGLYTTVALTIFMIENAIPAAAPIPGMKLGLANVVTLFVIKRHKVRDALAVLTVRIIISTILTGQMVSFIYSVCGGILSLVFMWLFNKLFQGRYLYVTSAIGGAAHNIGQIFAAYVVLSMSGIFAYVPFLIISGILTGTFTGLICYFTDKNLKLKIDI